MKKVMRLQDMTPEERAVVLALIAAKKAADETPAKVVDPVALQRLAGLIAPALKRSRK